MQWKRRMFLAWLGLPGLSIIACSQAPPPATPSEPAAASSARPAPPAAPVVVTEPEVPADGVWLKDDQGREYFVKELPMPERVVWLIPDQKIRFAYGETYDVVAHDDRTLRVKIYRVTTEPAHAAPPAPSAEELAQVAATYAFPTAAVDRLRFQPLDSGLPREGQWRNGFDVADMNGDGHLDIVHGPARKGRRRPNVFLGDGKGSWRAWAEVNFPALPYDYGDAAVADFNGDGRPDVALGVHLRGLMILIADGPNAFRAWGEGLPFPAAGVAAEFSSRAIAAADWNGDGRPDLIALGEGPRLGLTLTAGAQPPRPALGLAVYLNQGDGTWVESSGNAADRRVHGEELAVADVDGDARVDALVGSSVLGSRELLRRNRGDGTWSTELLTGLRPSAIFEGVAIADVDADGRQDLLVGYRAAQHRVWRSGIDLLFGSADGGFQRQTVWSELGRAGVTAVAAGDLDGDGKRDLAGLTGDGRTLVFLNGGERSFAQESSSEIVAEAGGCQGFDILARDLDGDGRADLITEFAGESSALFAPDACPHGGALRVWSAPVKPPTRGLR